MVSNTSALRLRLSLRDLRKTLTAGDKTTLNKRFHETVVALDKSVQKGILPKKMALRCKNRLSVNLGPAAVTSILAPPAEPSFIDHIRSLGYTRACLICSACSDGRGCDPK